MTEEKKNIKEILKSIEKVNGWDGSMFYSGSTMPPVETISTWSKYMDYVLWGWYVRGWITELLWESGCGKTLISMIGIKQAQSEWKMCMFVDCEMTFNKSHAEALWIDLDNLLLIRPSSWEDTVDIVRSAIEEGITFIVIDSVAAMVPRKETQDAAGQSNMWVHARLMNKFCRVITGPLNMNNATILLINQKRASMDMFAPVVTTWGKWLDYACMQRIEVLKPKRIDGWMNFRFKIIKNKLWMPYEPKEQFNMYIKYEWGIVDRYDVLLVWLELWVVENKWAWYYYKEEKANGLKWVGKREKKVIESIAKEIDKLLLK